LSVLVDGSAISSEIDIRLLGRVMRRITKAGRKAEVFVRYRGAEAALT